MCEEINGVYFALCVLKNVLNEKCVLATFSSLVVSYF